MSSHNLRGSESHCGHIRNFRDQLKNEYELYVKGDDVTRSVGYT